MNAWRLADIVRSKDGSLSLTKLAASTAHALMAAAFFRLQVLGASEFNEMLWVVYGGFAIAHATYDKTVATVKDFKDRKANREAVQHSPTTRSTE
jgi:hypothetical protein